MTTNISHTEVIELTIAARRSAPVLSIVCSDPERVCVKSIVPEGRLRLRAVHRRVLRVQEVFDRLR
jgi:hypothetical protein